jgi:peptide deformylase
MILPIYSYGYPVLRKKAEPISPEFPNLPGLIADMFETMYNAPGVGLAAPQVGLGIRLFVVDAEPMDEEKLAGFKKVFINPIILEEDGQPWLYSEGCLSLPGLHEDVSRPAKVRIRYFDEEWVEHEEEYEGLAARVIQHEYDHIEGVLFTDRLSSLKKRLLKGKLNAIAKGDCDNNYRMKFAFKEGR